MAGACGVGGSTNIEARETAKSSVDGSVDNDDGDMA